LFRNFVADLLIGAEKVIYFVILSEAKNLSGG